MSKVVEKVALTQSIKHYKEHQLMSDYQSAYHRNYSCESTVMKNGDEVLWGMEFQEVSNMCLHYLNTAFDTIGHDNLLSILSIKFGI